MNDTSEQLLLFSFRTHFLKADNVSEADSWYSALKHTQVHFLIWVCLWCIVMVVGAYLKVSGLPLQDQELTNNGIPIIVHKCVQFVESHGEG